jgi:hypothetical protein
MPDGAVQINIFTGQLRLNPVLLRAKMIRLSLDLMLRVVER